MEELGIPAARRASASSETARSGLMPLSRVRLARARRFSPSQGAGPPPLWAWAALIASARPAMVRRLTS